MVYQNSGHFSLQCGMGSEVTIKEGHCYFRGLLSPSCGLTFCCGQHNFWGLTLEGIVSYGEQPTVVFGTKEKLCWDFQLNLVPLYQ